MNPRILHLPRWLLSLEMLLCFLPLTFFTIVLIMVSMNGVMPIQAALPKLSATILGPIGLLVAFRVVALRQMTLSRPTIVMLCVLAAWTMLAFVLLALGGTGQFNEWWREFFLIALLPAIGCVHLILIGSRRMRSPTLS